VKIEAYEDFGCSHCLDFTADVEPGIFENYVATGKVSFEYKYFPLRQLTAAAAIAAECAAEQDKFWPYHRALYIAQAEANEKVGPPLTEAFGVDNLKAVAADLGLDAAAFDTCTQGDAAVTAVQGDLQKANELALPGTPSFVINGKVTPGPETFAGWKKLLDDLLK
jgi:protein-disulfide isomerase